MAKDIIFENKRVKPKIRSEGNYFGISQPLYHKYDMVNAFDFSQRKYVRGMVTQSLFMDNCWHYCVRPDYNQEIIIWTPDII